MKEIEGWDMLCGNGTEKKSLTQILDEMGFDKRSYMVINRNDNDLKIGDTTDSNGQVVENKNLFFYTHTPQDTNFAVIGNHKMQVISGKMTSFEAIDRQMQAEATLNNNGGCINGMVGSNNGVFCAAAHDGQMIITKDPRITEELKKQICFHEGLGVPLSNGGIPVDFSKRREWQEVGMWCKKLSNDKAKGLQSEPKRLKSPFRDNMGELTAAYKQFRATQLGIG